MERPHLGPLFPWKAYSVLLLHNSLVDVPISWSYSWKSTNHHGVLCV